MFLNMMQKPSLKMILTTAIVAYALICICMWTFQRYLIYLPTANIMPPKDYGLNEFVPLNLTSKDNTHITAWYHKARNGYPTLIYFHGKGGNLENRSHYFRSLADAGFGVFGIDYRGYGASEGNPSEEGLYQDARATMDYASEKLALAPMQTIIYGESIGTGVAVQIAREYPSGALILQSPFTSLQAIGEKRYPWLPVRFLLQDRFDSLSKITDIHTPLLLIHGLQDSVVPIKEGETLFANAPDPKEAVYFPDKGHNNLDIKSRTDALIAFCKKYKLIHGE